MLCKYRDILGKPNQGFHTHIFGIAIMDVVATILIAVLLWKIFHVNLWLTILALFILAILVHRLFCVNTTINKAIFGTV